MDISSPKQDCKPAIQSVSLGMVIIDEIRLPSRSPLIDVTGGSGTFVTLGSRLFAPGAQSRKVGCLILAGHDFPDAVRKQVDEWKTSLVVKVSADKLSTRGLLEYEDDTFGQKKFRYTTSPLKVSPSDLLDTELLGAAAFHFLATSEEVQQQVPELIALRLQAGITERPFIIWEPFPPSCTKEQFKDFLSACAHVDVFSPNHLELCTLFEDHAAEEFDKNTIEQYADTYSHTCIVVVRAGEHGSLTVGKSSETGTWLPPFYEPGSSKVVDTTGAGNAFLGGFMAGWSVGQDAVEASVYGNVAASFAVEQIGLPSLQAVGEQEMWNGVRVVNRLAGYQARLESL